MTKRTIIRTCLAAVAALILPFQFAAAQSAEADRVVGEWYTAENKSKVQIYRTTSGTYAGKIVWLAPDRATEPDGTPNLDDQNPDPSLRSRPVLGMNLMYGFKYDGDNTWSGGKIYDPESGKTYSAKMTLKGNDKLDMRGYVGISLIGRTTAWNRVK